MIATKAVDCYPVVFVRGGMLDVAALLSKGSASEVMDRQQSHDILTKKKKYDRRKDPFGSRRMSKTIMRCIDTGCEFRPSTPSTSSKQSQQDCKGFPPTSLWAGLVGP